MSQYQGVEKPYKWPEGKKMAVCFTVDVDVESPFLWRHRESGAKGVGELEQRRFGARVGLYRLLDLLDDFGLKGSFFVPGYDATTYPHILPSIAERGHEIGVHGFNHERVDELTLVENAQVLQSSKKVFQEQVGVTPTGYRSPSWELIPGFPVMLMDHGLQYDSSLMGYDHPYSVDGLAEIPVQWLTDDAVYFKYVGGGADKWPPANPQDVLQSWIEEWQALRDYGGLFNLTVHPWISGRGQRIRLLRHWIETVLQEEGVWWATTKEVADHHRSSVNWHEFDVKLQGLADGGM